MFRRFTASLSPVAMIISLLALVLTGAGVGYAAGTIGTSDIKNNAVTGKKVKNGSLKAADLVKQKKYTSPSLGNGGDGDCLWSDAEAGLPGLRKVAHRKDRFGTTHLSGIAVGQNGPGGDGACGGADAVADYTVFTLPEPERPAATLYTIVNENLLLIPGPGGLNLGGGVVIPHGAVLCSNVMSSACFLDGISFETGSAKVTARSGAPRPITPAGRALLKQLLKG